MRPSLSFVVLALPFLVGAGPIRRKAWETDVKVLKYAGVLEQLESQFYSQALSTFTDSDFTAAGFSVSQVPLQQIEAIASDEATHLSTINSTLESLGASPISNCTFDFTDALTNVSTMAVNARVVENLGVAAYLGAAHMLSDSTLLTAAASIMTNEARHQTILNLLNGQTSIPQSFDIALSPEEVLAVASSFISGCDVGFTANTALTVNNGASVLSGDLLSFTSTAINTTNTTATSDLYCQMLVGGATESIPLALDSCTVPSDINGPVAIFVTSDNNTITTTDTKNVVAGPAMIFVDALTDFLGELATSGCEALANTTDAASSAAAASATAATSTAAAATTTTAAAAATTTTAAAASTTTTAAAATTTAVAASTTTAAAATTTAVTTATDAGETGALTTTIDASQASSILSAASAALASAAAAAVVSFTL